MIGAYAFFWKGMKQFFASKSAVFWTFIFPIMVGLLFAGIFGHESSPSMISVGIVGEERNSTISDIFIENMKNITIDDKKLFVIKMYDSEEEALEGIKKGDVKAVIIFDKNFSENVTDGMGEAKLHIIFDKRDAQEYQLVKGAVSHYVLEFESVMREKEIEMALYYIDMYGGINPENKTYVENWLHKLADPLNVTEEIYAGKSSSKETRLWYETMAIGITFMFSGMIASASSISHEIERGTARRLAITRTKSIEMIVGNLFYVFAIEMISSILIIISFFVVFGDLFCPSAPVWGMIIAAAFSTISIGLLISSITKSEKAAVGAANAIAMPLSFITGLFFPEFLLPEWMRSIGDFFPPSALLRAVRKVVVFNKGIEDYIPNIVLALLSTVVVLAISAIAFKWRMKKE